MYALEGHSLSIFIVSVLSLSFSLISVCLRCFVRVKIVKAFGWDDALMVIAVLVNILFAICGITGSLIGIGQRFHVLIERGTVEDAMFWWWLGQTSYVWVCAITKVSIVLALLRLTVSRLQRSILWGIIIATCVISITFWALITLQCNPVSFFWRRVELFSHHGNSTVQGKCMHLHSLVAIGYLYSVTATVGDLTLGILPIFLVWNLKISNKSKAGLIAILGLGCIAGAAVIIRMPYIHDYEHRDFLYATSNISIWSNVEAGLGITAGSLVTLRPLVRWLRDPRSVKPRSRQSSIWPVSPNLSPRCSDISPPKDWQASPIAPPKPTVVTTINSSGHQRWRSSATIVPPVVNTPRHQRWNSSQEDFYHRRGTLFEGVNVEKSFYISEDDC